MRAPLGPVDFGFDSDVGKPILMQDDHLHHEIEVNYLYSGSMTYLAKGVLTTIPSGRLTVFWAAVPHRVLAVSPEARICWITIPLSWFLGWPLPKAFVSSLMGGRMLQAVENPLDTSSFKQWHADIRSKDPERQQIALLELQARMRRVARHPSKPETLRAAGRGPGSASLNKVEKIARHIAQHYTENIPMKDVARESGLNPNYATGLFHKICGMSPQQYLTRHRIFHAQRLLATTEKKILDIALESGFGSASQFYEVFQRTCQKSPRAYRMQFR